MKFTLHPDQFDQLAWIAKSAPQRPPAPILTGVRLTPTNDGLKAETFDYTMHTTAWIHADVHDGEPVIVPGRLLAEIVRALPKKTAQFQVKSGKLEVQCGSSKFRLNTMSADDYPAPPTAGNPLGCVSADTLFPHVSRALTAASRDDTLPLLAAVRFEFNDGQLSVLSTDRYRLTVCDVDWTGENGELLIPAKALTEVTRSLNGTITVTKTDNVAGFSDGRRAISVSLTEGDFPPVRRLIPAETSTNAIVNAAALIDVVKRVAILAERGTPVRLEFTQDTVTVRAGADDQSAVEELPLVEPLHGEPITTSFNPAFLLDGLDAQSTQDVRIGFTHPVKPVVFTPAGQESGSFTYLLVPIRS